MSPRKIWFLILVASSIGLIGTCLSCWVTPISEIGMLQEGGVWIFWVMQMISVAKVNYHDRQERQAVLDAMEAAIAQYRQRRRHESE